MVFAKNKVQRQKNKVKFYEIILAIKQGLKTFFIIASLISLLPKL
jgi:hypothetical protein